MNKKVKNLQTKFVNQLLLLLGDERSIGSTIPSSNYHLRIFLLASHLSNKTGHQVFLFQQNKIDIL